MRFLYFALDSEAGRWADDHMHLFEELGVEPMTFPVEQSETLRQWAQPHQIRAAIIRPDRYVWGCIENADDLSQKLAVLAAQIGMLDSTDAAIIA